MEERKDLPNRKNLRLKKHDYSSRGAYFVTICIKDRKPILSNIYKPVGGGAIDAPFPFANEYPQVQLSKLGKIVEKNLLSSENINGVKIDRYVIMPDHIHVIIIIRPDRLSIQDKGSSKAPTPTNKLLPHVVSTFKRFCNKEIGYNIFQRGYMEHIVRDSEDYESRLQYIFENPIKWYYGKMHEITKK